MLIDARWNGSENDSSQSVLILSVCTTFSYLCQYLMLTVFDVDSIWLVTVFCHFSKVLNSVKFYGYTRIFFWYPQIVFLLFFKNFLVQKPKIPKKKLTTPRKKFMMVIRLYLFFEYPQNFLSDFWKTFWYRNLKYRERKIG